MAKLVSATYGDALFEVAVEQNMVDALYEEAEAVLTSFRNNEELMGFINHPKIDKDEKIKTIESVFSRFVSEEMTGFLVTIVTKDRSKDIPAIFEYFKDRVREYKKIGRAYVTTPMELSADMKKKVEKKLLDTTDYVTFEMNYAVDKSLIGGMVIRIGDKIVDSSIRNKISELTKTLYKLDV